MRQGILAVFDFNGTGRDDRAFFAQAAFGVDKVEGRAVDEHEGRVEGRRRRLIAFVGRRDVEGRGEGVLTVVSKDVSSLVEGRDRSRGANGRSGEIDGNLLSHHKGRRSAMREGAHLPVLENNRRANLDRDTRREEQLCADYGRLRSVRQGYDVPFFELNGITLRVGHEDAGGLVILALLNRGDAVEGDQLAIGDNIFDAFFVVDDVPFLQ